MTKKKIIETTLAFDSDPFLLEAASEYPTHYRAMGRKPRLTHPFHSYDDILCQPEKIQTTLEIFPTQMEQLAQTLIRHKVENILFSGMGSSLTLAVSAAHSMWHLAGLPAAWIDSSEALLSHPVFNYRHTVVIGLSASGNTIETIEHIRACRQSGAFALAFVNKDNTRLTEAADESFVIPGGYGLIWDYSTRLAALLLLALALGKASSHPKASLEIVKSSLMGVPSQMHQIINNIDARCRSIGEMLAQKRAAMVAASGNLSPIAGEMALRFEEMAFFPIREHGLVNFIHGSIGCLSADIPLILLAPQGESHEYALRLGHLAQIIKSPSVAVLDENDQALAQMADRVIRLPQTDPAIKPFLYLLPSQLLPYYTAVAQPDGNPDIRRTNQPRYAKAYAIAFPPKCH
jgi:glucosamine--fructose-6-phosphate aminotransferase (isomerizing)